MSAPPNNNKNPSAPPPPPNVTMEMLIAKEREVAARAAELRRREREVGIAVNQMLPNFPPRILCIKPMVYHNIIAEVPSDRVRFVRLCFAEYFVTCVLLIYNAVVALMGVVMPGSGDASWGAHLALSIVALLGVVGAFILWYYPVYSSASTGAGYKLAYVGVVIACMYALLMSVGPVGWGGCGWLYTAKLAATKDSKVPAIMSLVCAVLWVTQVIFFIVVFFRLRKYSSEDKARQRDSTQQAARDALAGVAAGIAMNNINSMNHDSNMFNNHNQPSGHVAPAPGHEI